MYQLNPLESTRNYNLIKQTKLLIFIKGILKINSKNKLKKPLTSYSVSRYSNSKVSYLSGGKIS